MSEQDFDVIAVFDPDGGGQDFAYTSGLFARHGVAELHVWSRPSEGDDPGVDWMLSPVDCARLLNRLAVQALAGELDGGLQWVEVLDGGFTEMVFSVSSVTVPSPQLDTFQLTDGTPVRAVRFAIVRPEPDPSRWPVTPEVLASVAGIAADVDAAREARALLLGPAVTDAGVAGASRDAGASVGVGVATDGVFGVWSDVLGRLRGVVTSADSQLWDSLLFGALYFDDASRWSLGSLVAAGRACGRSELVDAALDAAREDAASVAGWLHEPDDPEFARAVERMLAGWLAAAYGCVVVGDVVESDVLSAGCGWLFALADPVSATRLWCDSHGVDPALVSGSLVGASEELLESLLPLMARSAAAGRGAPMLVSAELAFEVFNASS